MLTGLIPGIHPNTVVFITLPYYLQLEPGLTNYLAFIISISISHTFHDFLPAIFLHAPNATTALSTMPGAEAVEKGQGLKAFQKTAAGGLIAIATVLMISPILFLSLETVYTYVRPHMFYILIFFLLFAILNSENRAASAQVAALSGFLGLFSFNLPINQNFVLIPVFTGLFAVPSMTSAIRQKSDLPEQERSFEPDISIHSGVIGAGAGLLAGLVPGIGPAISTSFLSPLSRDKISFITALGGVNSSDILTSLLALYIIGAPRSGASVAINQLTEISLQLMVSMVGVALVAAVISYAMSLKVSKHYVKMLEKLNYTAIMLAVITGLIAAIYIFTGVLGVLILLTSSAIGFCGWTLDQNAVMMAVLIIPAILMFSGIGIIM